MRQNDRGSSVKFIYYAPLHDEYIDVRFCFYRRMEREIESEREREREIGRERN